VIATLGLAALAFFVLGPMTQPIPAEPPRPAADPTTAKVLAPPPLDPAPSAPTSSARAEIPQAIPSPSGATPQPVESSATSTPSSDGGDSGSDEIRITIPNGRRGLTVRIDGHLAAFPLRLPNDKQMHELLISTPNFKTEVHRIRADRDQVVILANRPGHYVAP
jgi:hypothetical protein